MAHIPITRSARIGLSASAESAFAPNQQHITLADLAQGGARPAQVIERSMGTSGAGFTLRYPADLPRYYFAIGLNDYSRSSWLEVGSLSLDTAIALPMPIEIVDNGTVEYEKVELGIPGMLLSEGLRAGANALQGNESGPFPSLAQAGAGAAADALGNPARAAFGVSVNQFQTIMLKGPAYKQHQFTWHFSPDTPQESRTLSLIKAALDEAKAPAIPGAAGAVFFLWPKVITLSFWNEDVGELGARLFRFKPCVITDTVFNFTTPGQPAFYGDTKAAQSMTMTLKLMELEYWLQGDPDFSGVY